MQKFHKKKSTMVNNAGHWAMKSTENSSSIQDSSNLKNISPGKNAIALDQSLRVGLRQARDYAQLLKSHDQTLKASPDLLCLDGKSPPVELALDSTGYDEFKKLASVYENDPILNA